VLHFVGGFMYFFRHRAIYSLGIYYFAQDSFFKFTFPNILLEKLKIQESHFVGDRCPSPRKIEKNPPSFIYLPNN
jgi:hypothetical protein